MKHHIIGCLLFSMSIYAEVPQARLTFRVVDDFGRGVPSAPVVMKTALGWSPGGTDYGHSELEEVRGATDSAGQLSLMLRCKTGNIREYAVEGRYDGMNMMEIGSSMYYVDLGGSYRFDNVVSNKWHPWDPAIEIQIKPVLRPVAMFARSTLNSWPLICIPQLDGAQGFDLVKSDWVQPLGKGEVADLWMELSVTNYGQRKIDRGPMYDSVFIITFTNKDDGILGFYSRPGRGSAFRSPRYAPEVGYTNRLVRISREHEDTSYHEMRDDQNYFFRVRTERDENGRVSSAMYGKIYGEIECSHRGEIRFVYYLNPAPNDRNMEFDPAQNLFTNLPSVEEVRYP